MIRRLQIKIIVVILGTLLIVFAAVLIILNLSAYQTSVKRTEDFMTAVVENDGFFFPPGGAHNQTHDGFRSNPVGNPEMMRAGRFFYTKIDKYGGIIELNLVMMFDFSREDAQEFITDVLDYGRVKGNIDNFSFLSADKPYGKIIVFAERSIEINLLEQLTQTSLWVALIVSLLLVLLAAVLSKWMVGPIETAFIKQRRFISDASHELKTPLTIISANADVLHNEIGDNKRLTDIKIQTMQMSGLVHDLLTMAKVEEKKINKLVAPEFNLSGAVLHATLEFESRAYEEGRQYTYNIMENVLYEGDEKQIKQLVSILIDNAIHYSDADGQIEVSLCVEGNYKIISVFNTGIGVADDEQDRIFERFYRVDKSRTRETGGYGIGLSIAKAIVEAHMGKIFVSSEYEKWIRFDVKL